jgi:hypothetical protein
MAEGNDIGSKDFKYGMGVLVICGVIGLALMLFG